MKILWIVNTIFPYPAEQIGVNKTAFGGWLSSLANNLKECDNIELAIATLYNGKNIKKFNDGKIVYYLIPGLLNEKYNRKLEKYWKQINDEFKPDLVNIHGTEFAHGLAFINACPNIKTVTSIQGLVSAISKVYYANIKISDILKNITLRDILRKDTIIQAKKKYEKRGKNEIEIIKKSNAIIGRTTWDYANCKAINYNLQYYISNETLRSTFYNKIWNIANAEKHTLFVSQGSYPIKGLHYAIEAVSILKNKYSDIKLFVAGNNIIETKSLKQRVKLSGYAKYLIKLIKKYNLENNIVFLGVLDESQMIDRLLKTHVFISPSALENSSNSLGEAMLLGMPCIASNVGGTMDMLVHKNEGFLYPYTEPSMLAYYISQYFENEDLCIEYGKNAKKTANKRHDSKQNTQDIINIYKSIIGDD